MYWTIDLAIPLFSISYPASKDELIDHAIRTGAPLQSIENLKELEDDDRMYERVEDIWPECPKFEDF